MAHLVMFRDLPPRNFQHLFLWVQISGVSIDMSLGCAIRSDMTNAPTTETFFVGSTFASTSRVAFARIVPRFGGNLLIVSDL